MSKSESVGQFWTVLEKQVGEDIKVFSLGEIKQPLRGLPASTVGMFFITAKALHFHALPKQSWFAAVLQEMRSKRKGKDAILYTFPLETIQEIFVANQNSLLRKLFTPNFRSIKIHLLNRTTNRIELLHFSLISKNRANELISYLEQAVESG